MILTWHEFFAGWIGGVAGLIISHPIDTLKVRLQHDKSSSSIQTSVIKTLHHEGIHGFYKGMAFPVLMAGLQNSAFFGVYANALRFCLDEEKYALNLREIPWLVPVFMAGCYGGMAQVLITTPVDAIKIKLQTRTGVRKLGGQVETPHATMWECIKGTYVTKGVRGFYHGFFPTICRDVPTSGVYISIYIYCDISLSDRKFNEFWSHFISGGIAGAIANAPVTPIDVIKTRLQADNSDCPRFNGVIDCVKKSYKQQGAKVFWKGLTLNCIRSFAANAGTFLVYEICLKFLYPETTE